MLVLPSSSIILFKIKYVLNTFYYDLRAITDFNNTTVKQVHFKLFYSELQTSVL